MEFDEKSDRRVIGSALSVGGTISGMSKSMPEIIGLPAIVAALSLAAALTPTAASVEPAAQTPPGQTPQDQTPTLQTPATPQPPPKPVPKELDSPRSTLRTFREAMEDPVDYELALTCLDLSIEGAETGRDNADRLVGILNRVEYRTYWQLPDAGELAARQEYEGLTEWKVFPLPKHERLLNGLRIGRQEIVLARTDDGTWKFSAQTVAGIEALYDRVARTVPILRGLTDERRRNISLWIESKLPAALVDREFITLKYWQWLGLGLVVFTGVMLDFVTRLLVAIISRRIISKRGGEARRETMRKTVRPFGLVASALFWLFTIKLLGLPSEALKLLLPAVRFFAMLAGVWAGFRLTDLVVEVFADKAARTETKLDDLLVPLVRKTIKILIFVFGLIYIADSMNIQITPLLTGLGIGGLGFAFAARDTLENIFGSVTVLVDRPFQVGDWIQIGDVEGTVENVGFRSTRVRTFYNSLVTIPNGNLVRAAVDNFGKRKYRRWKTHISLTYGTPPEKIDAFCEGVRELIRLHPYTRTDYYQVWLHQFGDSSLDILVYMFHEAPDWTTELRERHRLMLDIIRLADRLGVEFAFPTRTLHLHQEKAEAVRTPAPPPAAGDEERASGEGRRATRLVTDAAPWRRGKPAPYSFNEPSPVDGQTQIESRRDGETE